MSLAQACPPALTADQRARAVLGLCLSVVLGALLLLCSDHATAGEQVGPDGDGPEEEGEGSVDWALPALAAPADPSLGLTPYVVPLPDWMGGGLESRQMTQQASSSPAAASARARLARRYFPG